MFGRKTRQELEWYHEFKRKIDHIGFAILIKEIKDGRQIEHRILNISLLELLTLYEYRSEHGNQAYHLFDAGETSIYMAMNDGRYLDIVLYPFNPLLPTEE